VLQPGEERRRSGSHYTPRSLTEKVVRRTLEPLLACLGETRTPKQILELKICDPAMGSGAFLVAACRESYLLDYGNERSRFMFNFGDGAVAGLLVKDGGRNALLGCHGITDGSFSLQVKVPSGGSVSPNGGYRYLDVADPVQMKDGLDEVSLANFVAAARGALERSGATLDDIGYLCGIHMKPSMHRAIVAGLGLDPSRAAYLDDTGHMSGVDPLLALDRAARAGELRDGELVLLLAAGTGYTWAASVVRWGDDD
jgi:3-oxoacyl-[acyl-carrier-protein] synthase-3